MPHAGSLDPASLVTLALALDGLNRSDEALDVLEKCNHSSTDVKGTLAGRHKRQWLLHRRSDSLDRSLSLYGDGLSEALTNEDYEQAFYHSINLAFIHLMLVPTGLVFSKKAEVYAQDAISYCLKSPLSFWSDATQGEAFLIKGEFETAYNLLERAIRTCKSARDLDSMITQTLRVCEKRFDRSHLQRLETLYGYHPGN